MNKYKFNDIENRLGVYFNNQSLIKTALTHSSFGNQFKDAKYNERLEFLGDSVLQLCITEYLFNKFKDKSEGELTKIRSLIVCENSLYEIAKKLNLGEYIRMSKGEELTGGRERMSIQADAVEAVIAAVYLDKGIGFVNDFILLHFEHIIYKAINNEIVLDFKTKLQELLQKDGEILIQYELVKHEGPPHRRKFFTNVIINEKVMGVGEGYSKKEAEQNAAKEALKRLEKKYE
ncbi:ribonuclease III [Clostridium taeniosporum]|uniref:Ribonuclease 3 n=1 Tax=Clostridium taeniosporum TaxID=394958 RepID=A0A1D7XJ85_9CLOT|nr:ribonuclease III [Clostridium taeniosporum]AOR23250.1 ribonuclease III [Clostridium taeniosporum]